METKSLDRGYQMADGGDKPPQKKVPVPPDPDKPSPDDPDDDEENEE